MYVRALGLVLFQIALALPTISAMACASFLADNNNIKSGGAVKHFFREERADRILTLKNETSEICDVRLQLLDVIQRIDGRYRYVESSSQRVVDGSLSPYLDLVLPAGRSALAETLSLKPKEEVKVKIVISLDSPGASQNRTWVNAVRAFFPKYPGQLTLTEIYYSSGWAPPRIAVEDLQYDGTAETLKYTIRSASSHYTPIRFQLAYFEPVSGIELSSVIDSQGVKQNLFGNTRNFLLPNPHGEKILQSEVQLKSLNNLFKQTLVKQGVDPNRLNNFVLYVRPFHGFDWKEWKNNFYIPLSPQTVVLKINKSK